MIELAISAGIIALAMKLLKSNEKKVEQVKPKLDVKEWMKDNDISVGINIDEDTKRYYPYSNVASNLLGFSGSDNQGLDGIEAKYDEELKGSNGRIERQTTGQTFAVTLTLTAAKSQTESGQVQQR